MKKLFKSKLVCAALVLASAAVPFHALAAENQARWTEQRANDWYQKQPWIVGANFIPSDAVNEFEMWQAGTFDPAEIDRELGWAQGIGMNTMRVFLHNMLWEQDPEGFTKRIDQYLAIADKHHIRTVFVLFDSCWDPDPKLGPQPAPIPGVHNSRWVQAPGRRELANPADYPRLKEYVQGILGHFANDPRILAWDVWNEPENRSPVVAGMFELPNKKELVLHLLPQVFAWAREKNPSQPLTSGMYEGDWSSVTGMNPIQKVQMEESDVISFHNYGWPEVFEARIHELQQFHRPILCTEYMARGAGSTFDESLPTAKKYHVAAINWGLVKGKTQTYLPWDSWNHPYVLEKPTVWFHDVFHEDGTPYRQHEVDLIRDLTR